MPSPRQTCFQADMPPRGLRPRLFLIASHTKQMLQPASEQPVQLPDALPVPLGPARPRYAHAGAVTTDSLDCRPTKMPSPRAMPSADAAIILQWVVPRHDDTLAAACIVLLNRRDNEYIPKRHTELHTLFPPASQKWTLVSRGNRETLVALPTLAN